MNSSHRGALASRVLAAADGISEHWITVANTAVVTYATLPILAPLLLAAGYSVIAGQIYSAYSLVCHQLPDHTWLLLDRPFAYCQRDTAIYSVLAVAGIAYQRRRRWVGGLRWWMAVALSVPIAIDGGLAVIGVRDSDPILRTITGAMFAIALAWFVYPLIDRSLAISMTPRRRSISQPGVTP
jgi:uncharacterized membrane protein